VFHTYFWWCFIVSYLFLARKKRLNFVRGEKFVLMLYPDKGDITLLRQHWGDQFLFLFWVLSCGIISIFTTHATCTSRPALNQRHKKCGQSLQLK
jgi:hypothetical protein